MNNYIELNNKVENINLEDFLDSKDISGRMFRKLLKAKNAYTNIVGSKGLHSPSLIPCTNSLAALCNLYRFSSSSFNSVTLITPVL